MKASKSLRLRMPLAVILTLFAAICAHAKPIDLELWARGSLSLYDDKGEVFAGPDDWGVLSPYNWIGAGWTGNDAGWMAIIELGSDGWTDSSLRNLAFSYRFFTNSLKLSLGKPFIDDYTVHSYLGWLPYGSRLFDKEYGAFLEFKPRADLSIAGGFAVPLERDADGSYPDAAGVYDNYRMAVSYAPTDIGKFTVGYINAHDTAMFDMDGKELMVSVDLRMFKPVGLLLGYQGFFEGARTQQAFCAVTVPIQKVTLTADLMGQWAPSLDFQARGQVSYAFTWMTAGSDVWLFTGTEEFGVMPYATARRENGYLKLGFKYINAYRAAESNWSIPLTYDIWF